MSIVERVIGLPIEIEGYQLEGRETAYDAFTRRTTVVAIHGKGQVGRGEDVVYDADAQLDFQRRGPVHDLRGVATLRELSARLDELTLYEGEPDQEAYRDYRRWAFESAALDLALKQAETSLAAVVEREPRPVTFVASTNLGNPPTTDRIRELGELRPGLGFKLDASDHWNEALVAELGELGTVVTVDLKGAYHGTPVDTAADPELYRMILEGLPDAWIEDPGVTDETRELLAPHAGRITWDAPLHELEDVATFPWRPKVLNSKPSRFGSLERLFRFYEFAEREGIELYGGGQFELDCGRAHIQLLASLFHPDGPNDVAPRAYNDARLPDDAPGSPLDPTPSRIGFGQA